MTAFPEGAPCWVDASFPDVEAGKSFYGELFGWTFTEGAEETGYYSQALSDDKPVAGVAPVMPGQEAIAAWSVYFASPDVDATAAKIREAGGQLVMDPMDVMDFGRMVFAQDPGAAVFGVWQPGTHPGFGKKYEEGSFGWAEVCVRESEQVDAFYPKVFPIEAKQMGDEGGLDYKVWEIGGEAVAGRYKMGPEIPADVPPHVMVYFVVGNCDDAVATVTKLGGEVRSAPKDSPYGRFAAVADQQGATFSVIDPNTKVGEAPE